MLSHDAPRPAWTLVLKIFSLAYVASRFWTARSCIMQPDPDQEIYGMPEYLVVLNSAWLNASATLF